MGHSFKCLSLILMATAVYAQSEDDVFKKLESAKDKNQRAKVLKDYKLAERNQANQDAKEAEKAEAENLKALKVGKEIPQQKNVGSAPAAPVATPVQKIDAELQEMHFPAEKPKKKSN